MKMFNVREKEKMIHICKTLAKMQSSMCRECPINVKLNNIQSMGSRTEVVMEIKCPIVGFLFSTLVLLNLPRPFSQIFINILYLIFLFSYSPSIHG